MTILIYVSFPLATVFAFPEDTPNNDVTGSQDHPLISRFPGSYIRFYESNGFDEITLSLNLML